MIFKSFYYTLNK